MSKQEEMFSFSRISTYTNCPYSYYLGYVAKPKPYNEQNVYGEMGGICHECIEGLIKDELDIDGALDKFQEGLDDCDMLDMYFPSYKGDKELVKNNYTTAINHYFENFELYIEKPDFYAIEEYFEYIIVGTKFRGYIDYYYIVGDTLYCIDFKTSSKFSKKELEKKKLQLIIYGMYLQDKYPDKKIKCYFDMMKYVKGKRGGLKERHKLDLMETGDRGLLEIEFNEENVEQLNEYVRTTIEKLNVSSKDDENDWKPMEDCYKSHFCRNLCGFKKSCKYYQKTLTDK